MHSIVKEGDVEKKNPPIGEAGKVWITCDMVTSSLGKLMTQSPPMALWGQPQHDNGGTKVNETRSISFCKKLAEELSQPPIDSLILIHQTFSLRPMGDFGVFCILKHSSNFTPCALETIPHVSQTLHAMCKCEELKIQVQVTQAYK